MSKLWEIYDNTSLSISDNPEFILKGYADQLKTDTEDKFIGIVTESVAEETGSATYALYILVPKLKDYMYRLIEVNIQNLATPYPLELKFFAKDPKNHRTFRSEDVKSYKDKLEEIIKSPVTKAILAHLSTLIEIHNKG